ncbi:hypothetical protein CYLTODRAFT_492189 [Cylindrobasidium torrendii FP15055 ss-10]|uniref:Uncharacterized protein n=1 Tax=Cylindrobasidium torrendii FP15055 ss-10 TaxID=1314674 RepID=A0A0D7B5U6_9AGAR|nr:hypothetical protein CYLTODRAFT_492189 [Cylindrobasidium torrendii FP15055 ss-10]
MDSRSLRALQESAQSGSLAAIQRIAEQVVRKRVPYIHVHETLVQAARIHVLYPPEPRIDDSGTRQSTRSAPWPLVQLQVEAACANSNLKKTIIGDEAVAFTSNTIANWENPYINFQPENKLLLKETKGDFLL